MRLIEKKLCPKGKAAAKRKFSVYPSAYANMYGSAVCSGKVKPGGQKKVEESKLTPTPAERKKNPKARANDRGNRAATLLGKLSARIKSREDYPQDSPLHTGGSSQVDRNRMSKLKRVSETGKTPPPAALKRKR